VQKFLKKEALAFGWKTTKENLWFLIGLMLIILGASSALSYAADSLDEYFSFLAFLFSIANIAVSVILGMGLLYISLLFVDGKEPRYGDLLSPARHFWRYLGSSFLYSTIVFLGLLLFVVPGIIWAIKYTFYRYFVIEKRAGVFESMHRSGEITKGEKWNLFLFFILAGLINIAGALAFVIGLLVTLPLTSLAVAYVYRKLLG
jgi:uncharacterized membrane protein